MQAAHCGSDSVCGIDRGNRLDRLDRGNGLDRLDRCNRLDRLDRRNRLHRRNGLDVADGDVDEAGDVDLDNGKRLHDGLDDGGLDALDDICDGRRNGDVEREG